MKTAVSSAHISVNVTRRLWVKTPSSNTHLTSGLGLSDFLYGLLDLRRFP